jgi:tellurite resistance protein TerC
MTAWLWAGFIAYVLLMLAVDLLFINRKAHVVRARESLIWTGVCVAMALMFTGVVYYIYEHNWMGIASRYSEQVARMGPGEAAAGGGATTSLGVRAATEFITGWMIEYSLSLDNIFVIALIFAHFKIKPQFQHRLLFWGILGALVMRGGMIVAGSALIERFHWIIYVFGAILIFTAVKMLTNKEADFDPEHGFVFRTARKLLPVSEAREDNRFFVRSAGRLMVTPMFLVLLVIETTDVIFAVDSIPAIFAVTKDPFLVFTSNVFAIMGLRSLYFALASLMDRFGNLKFSLAFVLAFVGVKMLLTAVDIHISSLVSLGVIAAALAVGVGTSMFMSKPTPKLDAEERKSHRPTL